MRIKSTLLAAAAVSAAFMSSVAAHRTRVFSDTRNEYYDRTAREMAKRYPLAETVERDTSTFRFLTENTKKFKVDSLPLMRFDVGELYSGLIPVDKSDPDRSMFFVWQPTIGEKVDEVTIWFNGGPGCSSLEGFLQENGYFQWQWGQYSALKNRYSWVNLTNMLWVEYPIGTGFSQGKVTANTEEEIAQDFVSWFKNWQDTFGIKNFKIYVTGESYAGRYVPYVSSAMLDQKDKEYYDVSGALMYDPCIGQFEYSGQQTPVVDHVMANQVLYNFNSTFLSYLSRMNEYCGYANYTSTYMQFPPPGVQEVMNNAYPQQSKKDDRCDLWGLINNEVFKGNPCFNVYEINLQCPLLFDPLAYPTDLVFNYPGNHIYFNRHDVKLAMHAPTDVGWRECSGPVFKGGKGGPYDLGDYSLDPIQKVLPKVIEATNRVLVANGEYDLEIITNGTLLSIQNMTWNGKLGFQEEPTTPIKLYLPDLQWDRAFVHSGYGGLDAPEGVIMGTQHYERGLMWGVSRQSGHMQPQFQPRVSYLHLQWLLGRRETL